MVGSEASEDGPGGPGSGGGEADPQRWRQAVLVVRIAVAKVALDFLGGRHLLFQMVVVPAGVAAFVWWERVVGVVILVLALVVFLAYRLVSWVIERLAMPRHVRKALDGVRGEIRTELRRVGLPSGPVSGLRFAGRLVRGRRLRADLVVRILEAYRTIGPLVSRALATTGTPRPDSDLSP